MSVPSSTKWEIEPHTAAKHVILRNYLRAWFPIMGRYNARILFLDGYAGPGEYEGGQDGSPIIAIKEALNFLDYCEKYKWVKPEIVFMFIEEDIERATNLEQKIAEMKLPKKIVVQVVYSSFELASRDITETLSKQNASLAPAFLFIDPFGYNLPFELIQKLMQNDKCEVFINFMYEFINRFIARDGQENVMSRLFGNEKWKEIDVKEMTPSERKDAIIGLYEKQLQEKAAKYVRSFDLRGSRNSTKYFLVYGTNHKLGLHRMKDAMWKVDATGGFTFVDNTDPNQTVLFGDEPDFQRLKGLITTKFAGRSVSIEEIEDYVLCQTPYLPTHFKRPILNPMEKAGEITVVSSNRKKSGSFPEGTKIQFKQ